MTERRMRPAPLLFEQVAAEEPLQRFFGLEEIADPAELLQRAGELAAAFQAAADRAARYRALAAAELADPARFDRWTPADLAEHAHVPLAAAEAIIATGRRLQAEGYTTERLDTDGL